MAPCVESKVSIETGGPAGLMMRTVAGGVTVGARAIGGAAMSWIVWLIVAAVLERLDKGKKSSAAKKGKKAVGKKW